MNVIQGVLFFSLLSIPLFSESSTKKTGKVLHKSPYKLSSCTGYLPYNPKILLLNPDTFERINSYAKIADVAEVYCIGENSKLIEQLRKSSLDLKNVHFISLLEGSRPTDKIDKRQSKELLSSIDLFFLNSYPNDVQIFKDIWPLLRGVKVIHIKTSSKGMPIQKLDAFLSHQGYILFSYWEQSDQNGQAYFLKESMYKGVYERKFI